MSLNQDHIVMWNGDENEEGLKYFEKCEVIKDIRGNRGEFVRT